ncbi:MAG: biotin/lipoyl-binding protein [Candidatus Bathyarchaeota archaeon]
MKEHKVLVDGKPHMVKFVRIEKKTPFSVEIDGKKSQVELLNELKTDKPLLVKINGRLYKVQSDEFKENAPFFVRVNSKPYKVQYEIERKLFPSARFMEPTLPVPRKQPLSKPIVENLNVATAPMPGIVVSVKVKVGDSVSLGQPICILEAMKMENEINAPKAGIVKEIHVSEGSSVSHGQPMIVIE